MAKRGKASGAGEASVPPALSASERETVDASVASLSGLNLDQLRLQWRNQLGGIAPAPNLSSKAQPVLRTGLKRGSKHGGGQLSNVLAIFDSGFNPFPDQLLL